MSGPVRSGVYVGKVTHRRAAPFRHRFQYRTYSLLVDLDELDDIAARVRFFSHNRWNLYAIHDRDHGPRDGTALRSWIDNQLHAAEIDLDGGSVQLLTFPRVLGYAFNPLTIWFCRDAHGGLLAVLYEIHNTFGQSHSHLVAIDPNGGEPHRHRFSKELHVSPFFDQEGSYAFTLRPPGKRLSVSIGYATDDGQLLTATMTGGRRSLSSGSLLRVFFTHPLLTMKVTIGIHWHAARLWLKGARYRPRPQAPSTEVSLVGILGKTP